MTEVKIEKTVNRKLRKKYDKETDMDKVLDMMFVDLTSLDVNHIDELSDIDVYNLNQLLMGFMPASIVENSIEN